MKKITVLFGLVNFIIASILLFNNIFFIKLHLSNYSIILIFSYYICVFISFLFFNFIIYLICFKNQKAFKIIIFILLVSSFIIGYYSLKYQLNIDDSFVINVINEINHTKDVVSVIDIFIILLFICSLLYLCLKINIKQNTFKYIFKNKTGIIIVTILLFIFVVTSQSFKYAYLAQFNSYKGIDKGLRQEIALNINYYKYFYIIKGVIKYYKSNISNAEIMASIQEGDVFLNEKHNNITTIFIMSDSVRAKNMSLFGYNLDTNPNLQKLYDKNQIYLFKQNVCFTSTFVSLNCMLSFKKAEEFRHLETYLYAKEKITKYFNYLNIDTYYLSNNEVDAIYSGYKYVPLNSKTPILDSSVLPYFYDSIHSNSQFITLNLRGAHIPYDLMLEQKFKKFDHDYDNKILQTDYVWSNIITYLSKQDKPIFAIITADHGQSLGEIYNGVKYTVHGSKLSVAPPEQKEVPLIIYVNSAYKKLYPNYVENIKNNMKKYQGILVQSDIIFHSLLHCSAITGNIVDETLSLCSNLMK